MQSERETRVEGKFPGGPRTKTPNVWNEALTATRERERSPRSILL